MREIEFRAWLKNQKLMRYNVSIHDGQIFTGYCWIPFDNNVELMQYVGLKDKNGVKIFEGDIVQFDDDEIGIIKYTNGCFEILADGFVETFYDNRYPYEVEVIGNIYKNKELLEGEEK